MGNYLLKGQQSERLHYRKVEESDFDTWLAFCAEPESLRYIFSLQDQLRAPMEKCKLWFERVFERYEKGSGGMNALIEISAQAFVGQCGLLVQTVDGIEELEIGYAIMPDQRKRGYALEAARTCRDFAFKNNFSTSLISIINHGNEDSIKVAVNNGMSLEKNTIYKEVDVHIYRIEKGEWKRLMK